MNEDFQTLDKFYNKCYITSTEYYNIKLRIIEYYRRLENIKKELRGEINGTDYNRVQN